MITAISSPVNFRLPKLHPSKSFRTLCPCFKVYSAVGTSSPASVAEDDVLQSFLMERELTGDLIAKISDKIWIKQSALKLNHNSENRGIADVVNSSNAMQLAQQEEDESGGFLKLKRTNEWILGDSESAPVNKKMTDKEIRNDSEKRRRINLLKYEAV